MSDIPPNPPTTASIPPPSFNRNRARFIHVGLLLLHGADELCGEQNCSICLTDLQFQFTAVQETQAEEEQKLVRLDVCGHVFHLECILPWIYAGFANSHTCPNCRATLFLPGQSARGPSTDRGPTPDHPTHQRSGRTYPQGRLLGVVIAEARQHFQVNMGRMRDGFNRLLQVASPFARGSGEDTGYSSDDTSYFSESSDAYSTYSLDDDSSDGYSTYSSSR